MPTIVTRSTVRVSAEQIALTLTAQHRIRLGSTNEPLLTLNNRIPEGVYVGISPEFCIVVGACVNKLVVSANTLFDSAMLEHFIAYMRENMDELGISCLSKKLSESDNHVEVDIRSSFQLRPAVAQLISINLDYSWKAINTDHDLCSQRLFLPSKQLLDEAISKFTSVHLVKRYPYIFGPWRKALDSETAFFPMISRSISNIFDRSSNTQNIRLYKARMKMLRRHSSTAHDSLIDTLVPLFNGIESEAIASSPKQLETDEDILCTAMEHLFRRVVRPRQFKGVKPLSHGHNSKNGDEDEMVTSTPSLVDMHDPSEFTTGFAGIWDTEEDLVNVISRLKENDEVDYSDDLLYDETDAGPVGPSSLPCIDAIILDDTSDPFEPDILPPSRNPSYELDNLSDHDLDWNHSPSVLPGTPQLLSQPDLAPDLDIIEYPTRSQDRCLDERKLSTGSNIFEDTLSDFDYDALVPFFSMHDRDPCASGIYDDNDGSLLSEDCLFVTDDIQPCGSPSFMFDRSPRLKDSSDNPGCWNLDLACDPRSSSRPASPRNEFKSFESENQSYMSSGTKDFDDVYEDSHYGVFFVENGPSSDSKHGEQADILDCD